MSEFSVHRTPDRIPGLMYCLVLDGKRIAGGKPDCSGDNIVASWSTKETYGQVEGLMADVERYKAARDASVGLATKTIERIRELEDENAKLRELCRDFYAALDRMCDQRMECGTCMLNDDDCSACDASRLNERARELGVSADG